MNTPKQELGWRRGGRGEGLLKILRPQQSNDSSRRGPLTSMCLLAARAPAGSTQGVPEGVQEKKKLKMPSSWGLVVLLLQHVRTLPFTLKCL